jgi:hypothetical protein
MTAKSGPFDARLSPELASVTIRLPRRREEAKLREEKIGIEFLGATSLLRVFAVNLF